MRPKGSEIFTPFPPVKLAVILKKYPGASKICDCTTFYNLALAIAEIPSSLSGTGLCVCTNASLPYKVSIDVFFVSSH